MFRFYASREKETENLSYTEYLCVRGCTFFCWLHIYSLAHKMLVHSLAQKMLFLYPRLLQPGKNKQKLYDLCSVWIINRLTRRNGIMLRGQAWKKKLKLAFLARFLAWRFKKKSTFLSCWPFLVKEWSKNLQISPWSTSFCLLANWVEVLPLSILRSIQSGPESGTWNLKG